MGITITKGKSKLALHFWAKLMKVDTEERLWSCSSAKTSNIVSVMNGSGECR